MLYQHHRLKNFITCRQGSTQFASQLPLPCEVFSSKPAWDLLRTCVRFQSKLQENTHLHHLQQQRLLHTRNPYQLLRGSRVKAALVTVTALWAVKPGKAKCTGHNISFLLHKHLAKRVFYGEMQKKAGGGKEEAAAALSSGTHPTKPPNVSQYALHYHNTSHHSTTHQPPGRRGAWDSTESITSNQTFKLLPTTQNLGAKPQYSTNKRNKTNLKS